MCYRRGLADKSICNVHNPYNVYVKANMQPRLILQAYPLATRHAYLGQLALHIADLTGSVGRS